MTLPEGALLANKYEIMKHLGEGRQGHVYQAKDRLLKRTVAIKHLRLEIKDQPEAAEHFLEEARTIVRVRDENVIAIHGIEEEAGSYYLVMEYAGEGSVADVLQREGRLPVLRALEVGLAAARALAAVHAEGILHGDIKPGNILLVRGKGGVRAKLADFGLSQMMAGISADETFYFGSGLYASPEQVREEVLDRRSDLYALGAVLYEMLTGQPPFPYPNDLTALFRCHLEEQPLPPSQLAPDLLPGVDEVILKALNKSPDERFPDAQAMAQALEQAIQAYHDRQERVERAYTQGTNHEKREEWEQAVACYERVLAEQPGHNEARARGERIQERLNLEKLYQQGCQAFEGQTWAEAEQALAQVVAYDPDYAGGEAGQKFKVAQRQRDLEQRYNEAKRLETEERWSEAEDHYFELYKLDRGYKDVAERLAHASRKQKQQTLYDQAQISLKQESWSQAVKKLEELGQLGPAYKDSQALLAQARRQGHLHELYTQAVGALHKGEWRAAIQAFDQVLQLEPGYKDAAIRRATAEREVRLARLFEKFQTHTQAEDWTVAAATLQEIKAAAPTFPNVDRLLNETIQKQRVADLYQKGIECCRQTKWGQAIQYLEEALELQPGYRDAAQKLQEAKAARHVQALFDQARQREAEKKWSEAVELYLTIIRLDPNHQDAKEGLKRANAAAVGREETFDAEQRERTLAIAGALLVIAALSCMLFAPLSRMAGAIFASPTSTAARATMAVSPSVRLTLTPTRTPTFTPTKTPSPSPTLSHTPVPPPSPTTPSSTPTRTSTATATPTRTPTKTGTVTPSHTPTFTPSHTPTFTPTLTRTPTRSPTPTPVPLRLLQPEAGTTVSREGKNITFEWEGSLRPSQAFKVILRHVNSGQVFSSPEIVASSWQTELLEEHFGEYRWQVFVVQDGELVAGSGEWYFWFAPFFPPPTPTKI